MLEADLEQEFARLSFPDAPKIVVRPPGPAARRLLQRQKELDSNAVLYPHSIPTAWESGKGSTLRDVDGNIYIDFYAGIAVLPIGHSHPAAVEVLKKQAEKLIHSLDIPSEPRIRLLEKLFAIAPGDLKGNCKILLGSPAGADANEAAIKLCKFYTGKPGLISFEGGYHGQTTGALSLVSKKEFKFKYFPLMPGVTIVPYPYCYRCPFGKELPCELTCARYIEHLFKDPDSGLAETGGVIVEPIQGESGIVIPPNGFFKELKRICQENSALLVFDEVQAGLGRTGRMFACEHVGVTPDVITMAKALGGIGLPMAGMMYRKNLDTWAPGAHVGTFRGNVLGCEVGAFVLDYMEKKGLVQRAQRFGEYMLKAAKEIGDDSKHVGDVRGRGLMVGLEFVKDKVTKEPATELAKNIQRKCFESGLLVWKAGRWSNTIRFLPSLTITRELVDKGLEIFSKAVKDAERVQ